MWNSAAANADPKTDAINFKYRQFNITIQMVTQLSLPQR